MNGVKEMQMAGGEYVEGFRSVILRLGARVGTITDSFNNLMLYRTSLQKTHKPYILYIYLLEALEAHESSNLKHIYRPL